MAMPKQFVDAHHHFIDVERNEFQTFFRGIVPGDVYLPQHYHEDVVKPLARVGVQLVGSVHVECMPDDGWQEAAWVESFDHNDSTATVTTVKAIVGSCNLASPTVDEDLTKLKMASPKVRGVRWILDCMGPFQPGTATHIATSRHDGIDYLRGSHGGYQGSVTAEFERGFALLAAHGLSFDLQCAPAQLLQAAALFARHPNVPVCLDHLGKPRTLLGPDDPSNTNTIPDTQELECWREGMKAMAALPHVHVKLSMLGYAVPGWIRNDNRIALVRQLVLETVNLFGPKRCMVALNWWKSPEVSDADCLSDVGPDPVQYLQHMSSFFKDYSDEDRERLFVGTAKEFYRF